jgi:hypothetical protein
MVSLVKAPYSGEAYLETTVMRVVALEEHFTVPALVQRIDQNEGVARSPRLLRERALHAAGDRGSRCGNAQPSR